jgi:hypothetical protein
MKNNLIAPSNPMRLKHSVWSSKIFSALGVGLALLLPLKVQAEPLRESFCPVSSVVAEQLTAVRNSALPELKAKFSSVDQITALTNQESGSIRQYQTVLQQSIQLVKQSCQGNNIPKQRGMWLRAYPNDGKNLEVLGVLDQMLLAGVTDIYLESFYESKTLFPIDNSTFSSWLSPDQGNLLKLYTDLAHQRGMRVHAWIRGADFGPDYAVKFPERSIRNAFGQVSNLKVSVQDPKPAFNPTVSIPDFKIAEAGHWFVDPSHPQVQKDLQTVVMGALKQGVDGIALDYIRYPVAQCSEQKGCLQKDPRLLWLFAEDKGFARFLSFMEKQGIEPKVIDQWINKRNTLDTQTTETLARLTDQYLRSNILNLVQQTAQNIPRNKVLTAAVWSEGNQKTDSRMQPYDKFPLTKGPNFMNYSYDPVCNPATPERSCITGEYDRALSFFPTGEFCTILAPDPPYRVGQPGGDHHAALSEQVKVLQENAQQKSQTLDCLNYFAFGWIYPENDQRRKVEK